MSSETTSAVARAAPLPRWSLLIGLGAVLFVIGLLVAAPRAPFLLKLEHSTADLRTTLFSHRRATDHPDVALVKITDASNPTVPIDRTFLADVVKAVDAAGATAIGLDYFFRRTFDPAKDRVLQQTLKEAQAAIVLAAWDERGLTNPAERKFQADFLAATGRKPGFINLRTERDDIVRYMAEPGEGSGYTESFPLLLARTRAPSMVADSGRIAWLQKVDSTSPLAWLYNHDGASPFAEVTAAELMGPDPAAARARIKGKIALIGPDLQLQDRHRTPLATWTQQSTPGVAIHAQIVAQLLDGRRLMEISTRGATILVSVLAAIGAITGFRFRNRKFDFLSWGTATMILTGIDIVLFKFLHIIVPFLVAMLAWFAGVLAGHHLGFVYDWTAKRKASP